MDKRIVFIVSSLSQPRILKRITSLKDAGFDVVVYGYDRNVYNCNRLRNDIKLIKLNTQENGKEYLKKVSQSIRDVKTILRKEQKGNTLFYAFSFYSAFLLFIKGVRFCYEISDILYGYNKYKLFSPFLKFIDKKIIKSSVFTLMTSAGFKTYFFGDKNIDNVVIQPNKLNSFFYNIERDITKFSQTNSLTFSYIGAVRYFNTVLRFAKIIGKYYPNHKFYFYGDSINIPKFKEETKQYSNVIYFGEYKNPEDLEKIYSTVDVVIACYESETLNERIAEPNKLYEAMYFCKPIVVSKNTFLEKQVEKFGCGYAINAYSDDEIKNFIDNINVNEFNSVAKNNFEINSNLLIDNPNILIERINKFFNDN